jgi:hypothetical protein
MKTMEKTMTTQEVADRFFELSRECAQLFLNHFKREHPVTIHRLEDIEARI